MEASSYIRRGVWGDGFIPPSLSLKALYINRLRLNHPRGEDANFVKCD
jgi:hypothetical protein